MARRKKSDRFVSRGGDKHDGALSTFGIDVAGKTAADLGSNVGGFTDCLLQRGARSVYSVDTGYGVLAWKLRTDARVKVMERVNALHVSLPEKVYLVAVDVGWTPMSRIAPVAIGLVTEDGCVVALLKPQYESTESERVDGIVLPEYLEGVLDRTVSELSAAGLHVVDRSPSSIPGSGGNQEYLLLIRPV